MVPNVRVVGSKAGQVVNQAENDQKTGDARQNEHHLGRLHAVLAEGLHFQLVLDL